MTTKNRLRINKDAANKKIMVTREFDAPVAEVWKSWTSSEILDTWWAPKPWKAETKKMDFRAGGMWLYAMVGPAGERHWSRADFETVDPGKSFTATDYFCDENGNKTDSASMHWKNNFNASSTGTTVEIEITFDSEEGMKKFLDMGFEQGFAMGLENLDEVLAK